MLHCRSCHLCSLGRRTALRPSLLLLLLLLLLSLLLLSPQLPRGCYRSSAQ
jgi:hypothetical protein